MERSLGEQEGSRRGEGLQQEASCQPIDGSRPEISDTKEFLTEGWEGGREKQRELRVGREHNLGKTQKDQKRSN